MAKRKKRALIETGAPAFVDDRPLTIINPADGKVIKGEYDFLQGTRVVSFYDARTYRMIQRHRMLPASFYGQAGFREYMRAKDRLFSRINDADFPRFNCLKSEVEQAFVDGGVALDDSKGWFILMSEVGYQRLKAREQVMLERLDSPLIDIGMKEQFQRAAVDTRKEGAVDSAYARSRKIPEARSYQILHALGRIGIQPDHIKMFVPEQADMTHPDHSDGIYKIIEVRDTYGNDVLVHIAVCDYRGWGVYVIRDPDLVRTGFESEERMIKLDDLKDSPRVWRFADFTTADRWDLMRQYIFTSLEDLKPQNKRRVLWADKGDLLKDALWEYALAHDGKVPPPHCQKVIGGRSEIGAATWDAAYQAFNRGTIKGLEGFDSFHALLESIEAERKVVDFPAGLSPVGAPACDMG